MKTKYIYAAAGALFTVLIVSIAFAIHTHKRTGNNADNNTTNSDSTQSRDRVNPASFTKNLSQANISWSNVHTISSLPHDPGLFVCSPASTGSLQPGDHQLGDGMAHWLQFYLAGMPYFSRSQFWIDQQRVGLELHHPKLHLIPSDLFRLFSSTGVTDALLLSISRNKNDLKLTATIYGSSSKHPLATPLVISGSPEAVTDSLPLLAKALATELGVTDLGDLPASTGLTADEMKFIGSISLKYDPWLPPDSTMNAKLDSLAKKSPLAAAMALGNTTHPLPIVIMDLPAQLSSLTPVNTSAVGILVNMGTRELIQLKPVFDHNVPLWPHNYVLAMGSAKLNKIIHGAQSDDSANYKRFQLAALTDPKNPQAWVALSNEAMDNSDNIRHYRLASDISQADWQQLNSIYSQVVADAQKATSLDKFDPHALTALAVAECFEGKLSSATQVLQSEQLLYPNRQQSYTWGLQMYQSKWMSGDDDLLISDCTKFVATSDYGSDAWDAVTALKDDNLIPESQHLANTILKKNQTRVQKNPTNLKYKYLYASVLLDDKKISKAMAIYSDLSKSEDYAYLADTAVGSYNYQMNHFAPAATSLQAALDSCPDDHGIYGLLGYSLRVTGHANQGIAFIQKRLEEDPYDWYAEENMGEYYAVRNNFAKAIPLLQDSVDRHPFQSGWVDLVQGYITNNDNAKGISTGLQGIKYDKQVAPIYFLMGDGYYQEHDYHNAEKYYEMSLAYNRTYAPAYNNAGDAYRHTGDIQKARAYWKKCLTLTRDPQIIADAQTHINKYH